MNPWTSAGNLLLLAVFLPGFSQAQQANDPNQVELDVWAKDFSAEWAKNLCVAQWTEPDRLNTLSRVGGSVAELCKCTQESFRSIVSVDLAVRLVRASAEERERPAGAKESDTNVQSMKEFGRL